MAITAEIIQKRLIKLQSVLLTSGLQQKDQPLYQVISQLIQSLLDAISGILIITGSGGGSGGSLSDQPYLTHQNALAALPQSRQLLAGSNVNFDDSVFGQRIIDVLLDQVFLTGDDETATLPNSRQLLAGTFISFDDSVPGERTVNADEQTGAVWSVLSNGDVVNPELIFTDGQVIMLHMP